MSRRSPITVRNTRPEDFPGIIRLSEKVYPKARPWRRDQLSSHLEVFPEGQFVALDMESNGVVGMAASLIVSWEDYEIRHTWREITAMGTFTNHDPAGRTLYGAEVMVDPDLQRKGVGSKIYRARRELVRRMGLRRIRAGARLRGYRRYADKMGAEEYVQRVLDGKLKDPTLSFQLKQGFKIIAVLADYLPRDPESRGFAAVIEWLNEEFNH